MNYRVPISVIMPCYNSERFISMAIESILNQSFLSFELIIVDDGSCDSTESQVSKFNDKRIRYVRNEINRGNYASRNLGMSLAGGKYICMMDADDIALPNRLEIQFKYLESHRNVGCIGGFSEIINETHIVTGSIERPVGFSKIRTWLLKDNYVTQPTIMLRSYVVKKYRLLYDESLRYSGDYDFIVRASKLFTVDNLDVVLVKYRVHPAQISSVRRSEQITIADEVRIRQLSSFGITCSDEEVALHLKLMRGKYIADSNLQSCEDWLNRLYEANHQKRLYKSTHLYDLFQGVLMSAVANNSLGGWSIEKETIAHIRKYLPDGKSILEFGSGNGTEALLEFYAVTSIEHDSRFSYKRKDNHKCIFAPIQKDWYQRDCVKMAFNSHFDFILIDGPPGELRKGILNNLDLFEKTGVPILFDDINRKIDREIMIKFCDELKYDYTIIGGTRKAFALCMKAVSRPVFV